MTIKKDCIKDFKSRVASLKDDKARYEMFAKITGMATLQTLIEMLENPQEGKSETIKACYLDTEFEFTLSDVKETVTNQKWDSPYSIKVADFVPLQPKQTETKP